MPARLVIDDGGDAARSEIWIEKPFVVIGTAAGSDVPLDPAAGGEACVYLQFRDDRYEVFNKQAADVAVGGRAVPPGRSAAWDPRETLVVGGRRLRLEITGDPTPAPRPIAAASAATPARRAAPAADERPAAPPERAAAQPPAAGQGRALQMAAILGCVAVSTLLLFKDRLPSVGSAVPAADEFAALVTDAFPSAQGAAPQASAGLHRRLARRLQWAEAAWLAGDREIAGERYARLKRYLDGTRHTVTGADAAAPPDEWRRRLAQHVDLRLDALAEQSDAF